MEYSKISSETRLIFSHFSKTRHRLIAISTGFLLLFCIILIINANIPKLLNRELKTCPEPLTVIATETMQTQLFQFFENSTQRHMAISKCYQSHCLFFQQLLELEK